MFGSQRTKGTIPNFDELVWDRPYYYLVRHIYAFRLSLDMLDHSHVAVVIFALLASCLALASSA